MMLTIQRLPVPVIARVQGIATARRLPARRRRATWPSPPTARASPCSGVNLGLFCSSPSVRAVAQRRPQGGVRDARHRASSSTPTRHATAASSTASLDATHSTAQVESLVAAIVAKPRVRDRAAARRSSIASSRRGIEAAYEDAGRTMACNMMEADTLEGVQAFIDKRKPAWPS